MTSTLAGQTVSPFKTPAYQYIREADELPSTDNAYLAGSEAICKVKLFNPTGIGTWWIAGFDPETGLAYGVARLFEVEAGDFDMNELIALRTPPFRLPIERDLWYTPRTIADILSREQA